MSVRAGANKALYQPKPTFDLLHLPGLRLKATPDACIQCGKCTAGCPLAYKMDEAPTAIMRYIQLGLRDEAVRANTSWVCVSCQTCSTRCPQDVDIAGVMDGLRRISKRSGYGHVDRIVRTFLDVFLGTIKRYGRLYALGLIASYNIASLQPFKDFSVDQIGSMLKSLDVPEIEDEDDPLAPLRVIGLVCENDAYPALDAAAMPKLRLNPMIRFISLRCLGSFNMVWVSDALSRGVDGIILLGCKHGDDYQCHFAKGSELCEYRMSKLSETLDKLGLESDRVIQYQIGHSDFDLLPKLIDDFVARVREIGPNPFKEL